MVVPCDCFAIGPMVGDFTPGDLARIEDKSSKSVTCACEYPEVFWKCAKELHNLPLKGKPLKIFALSANGSYVSRFDVQKMKGDRYRVKKKIMIRGTRQRIDVGSYTCVHSVTFGCGV